MVEAGTLWFEVEEADIDEGVLELRNKIGLVVGEEMWE